MKKEKYSGIYFKNLKKRSKHWGYPIKIKSKTIKVQVKEKYKDSLFTKLFNNKEAALQLYNTLYHRSLPEDTPVQMITLDDILFTKRKNDVAFIVDNHFLIFIEHQSTINENMPLRLLLYVVQEYEKLIGYRIVKGKQVSNKLLYGKKRIPIPKPEFFVLYNGKDDLKEVQEDGTTKIVTEKMMRLSDAFIEKNNNPNSLELCVKLIDIKYPSDHQSLYENSQQNEETLSLLGEYSYFINKIEELKEQDSDLKDAIKKAINHCIENDILKDFLLKNETEVVTMLFGVYDEEVEKQVIREEAMEEVREEERAKAALKIQEERAKRANDIIDLSLGAGYSNEKIITILQAKLEIKEKQADDYLKKFYDKNPLD